MAVDLTALPAAARQAQDDVERLEAFVWRFINETAPGTIGRDAAWREINVSARHFLRFPPQRDLTPAVAALVAALGREIANSDRLALIIDAKHCGHCREVADAHLRVVEQRP